MVEGDIKGSGCQGSVWEVDCVGMWAGVWLASLVGEAGCCVLHPCVTRVRKGNCQGKRGSFECVEKTVAQSKAITSASTSVSKMLQAYAKCCWTPIEKVMHTVEVMYIV